MNLKYIIIFALLCGGGWAEDKMPADIMIAHEPPKVTFANSEKPSKPCMIDRAYTVKEIDKLRSTIETRWLFGTTYTPPPPPPTKEELAEKAERDRKIKAGESVIYFSGSSMTFGRSYTTGEKEKAVEELVRTAMLAGFTAEDIRAEDKRLYEESNPSSTTPPTPAAGRP